MKLPTKSWVVRRRDERIALFIKKYIKEHSSILDIGCGGCEIARQLKEMDFEITPVDIKNKSRFREIVPVLYDGKKLPFKDNSFDVSILITVLHHTEDPEKIIKEAARVSKKIIILEDIYKNRFQKCTTCFFDSLVNFEFSNHPHNNKNDREWRQIFKRLKLKLIKTNYGKMWGVFNTAFYCLEVLG